MNPALSVLDIILESDLDILTLHRTAQSKKNDFSEIVELRKKNHAEK